MKRTVIVAAASLCVLSLAPPASSDTLVMRDGTRIEGTVVGIAARTIMFRHADGTTRRYTTTQVEALEFLSAERVNPRAVNARRLEAPAGTELVVRTVEVISSRSRGADQNFSAIVERDVRDASGVVMVPEGSSVQLVIRQMSSHGEIGSPEMALDLQSITIDGRRYLVNSTLGAGTGNARKRRTGEAETAGAAVGTIVGATAGGANGAAIGGAADAAGGARVEVLTKGREIQVPAETVLTFRLDSAVTLQAP